MATELCFYVCKRKVVSKYFTYTHTPPPSSFVLRKATRKLAEANEIIAPTQNDPNQILKKV